MSETLRVAKMTVSEQSREPDQATEEAIKELLSQLADLRMLVRTARTSGDAAATELHHD